MRKKLLSSILIIAMLFNMCISFNVVYATDSKAIFDITGPAEAYRGATVNVKVSATIVADTSIQGVETNFEYSDNFSELNVIGNPITVNTIGWGNVGITKTNLLGVGFANAAGGVLEGVLSFNIPEDAPFGTQYTISFGDVYAVSGSGEEQYRIVNDSYTVTVVDLPEIPDVEVDNTTVTFDGDEHTIDVSLPEGATIQYSEDGDTYSDVMPTYKNVGEYDVYYIVSKDGFRNTKGTATVTINKKELSDSMIETITAQRYTGSKITPTIIVKDGEPSILTPADYEIVGYGENINVATGGSVTIEGKGNYKGTATKYFEISKATMDVQDNDYEGTYDGIAHTGSVVVSKPSNAVIKYGTTDGVYESETIPTYTNAGTYTIYYKATDANFNDATGSITVKINAKEVTPGMIENIEPITYTGSKITPTITVKDGEPNIITSDDYEVVGYGENINVATGGSVTIEGKGNYKGTATKTFEISRATMEVSKNDYEGIYDGTAHTGSVVVSKPSNAVIKYGTTDGEYELETIPTYTNAGTYTIYYQATDSNYETVNGNILVKIEAKELEPSMVDNITAQEYTGSQIKPTITVKDGEPSIITSDDYDITYGENITVATGGSVTIEGKGNYKGTITKEFEISLAVLNVSKTDYTGVYDGLNHKGSITVDEECETTIRYGLVDGEYTMTEMPEYKNAGTYKVYYKVDADNYSSATGYVTVSISTKDLSENMISGVDESYVYTGVAINPTVTITDGEPNIITSDDYEVIYGENINVATGGSVTITGKGNYSGEIVCDFAIQKAPLTISTINKTVIYGDTIELPINYTGFVNSETETVLLTQPIVSGYGNNPSVGEYDLIISGATADNYEITYDNTSKLSVDKRNVSISSLTVFDKLHDGTDVATINVTSAIFAGVINDDVLLLDISQATATFSSSEVGNDIPVNIAGLAIKGDSSSNYALNNDTYQTTADITSSISASQIAQQITSLVIDRNASVVEFPELPSGYTVSIKTSSDASVIDLQGNVYDFDESKTVDIVLTISNDDGTDIADTAVITVTVPASVKLTVTVVASENGTATGSGDFFKYENVTVSAVPNSGYEFEGWYIGTEKVSGDISYTFALTEATTLVAKFKETQRRGGGSGIRTSYTVKVHLDDEIISYKAYRNDTVKSIKTPQKEGFVFEGWFSDSKLTKPVAMETKITSSISLYPKMTPVNVPDDWNNPFVDINESDWYFESVKFVVEQGLFKGISENQFGPDMHVTRGMLVTVMYRAEGEPEVEMNNGFIDVEDNAYYAKAISWAKSNNIVNGYDSETFGPNDSVTREQIATIIARYSKLQGLSSEAQIDTTFADSNAISDWAVDSVRYCKQIGLILGDDNNQFNPQNSTTRAETATILYRYVQMIK